MSPVESDEPPESSPPNEGAAGSLDPDLLARYGGPVPEALVEYVAYWGETRGWTNVEAGEPVDATVGGRAASRVDITATDGNGRAFRAAYVWVRTNNREVLITAVTPPENWDTYAADLDAVLTDWFWHRPEGTSAEETTTP